MKSLRRSLNNNNDNNRSGPSQPSPPLPGSHSNPLSRPSGKVAPPQKVIKALATHRSTNPQELSYQEGDFWYVTSERDGWYEALSELSLILVTDVGSRVPDVFCRSAHGFERAGAEDTFRGVYEGRKSPLRLGRQPEIRILRTARKVRKHCYG